MRITPTTISTLMALLLCLPAAAAAGSGGTGRGEEAADLSERLHQLEGKYQKTEDPKYLYRRLLVLEKMGEHEFALEILENHRESFVADPEISNVAVVEQRLRDAIADREEAASSGAGADSGSSRASGGRADILGWVLTGAGAATLGGGIAGLLVAESQANKLRCSPAGRGPDAAGCGGVSAYGKLSAAEFDRRKTRVRTLRIVGIGLSAVGVGAATWGLVRLLTAERSPDAARARLRPAARLDRDRLSFGLTLDF